MKIIRKMFEAPESYVQSVKHYSTKDTAMAMGLFILYCSAMAVSGLINKYLSALEKTVSGIIINSCFIGVVLLFLVAKKQGIETVGLKKGNIRLSLIIGLVLAAILFFCNCLSHIIFEAQVFVPFKMILIDIIYFFTVGLCEELTIDEQGATRFWRADKGPYGFKALANTQSIACGLFIV